MMHNTSHVSLDLSGTHHWSLHSRRRSAHRKTRFRMIIDRAIR